MDYPLCLHGSYCSHDGCTFLHWADLDAYGVLGFRRTAAAFLFKRRTGYRPQSLEQTTCAPSPGAAIRGAMIARRMTGRWTKSCFHFGSRITLAVQLFGRVLVDEYVYSESRGDVQTQQFYTAECNAREPQSYGTCITVFSSPAQGVCRPCWATRPALAGVRRLGI